LADKKLGVIQLFTVEAGINIYGSIQAVFYE
jgi:hypothetical protein